MRSASLLIYILHEICWFFLRQEYFNKCHYTLSLILLNSCQSKIISKFPYMIDLNNKMYRWPEWPLFFTSNSKLFFKIFSMKMLRANVLVSNSMCTKYFFKIIFGLIVAWRERLQGTGRFAFFPFWWGKRSNFSFTVKKRVHFYFMRTRLAKGLQAGAIIFC